MQLIQLRFIAWLAIYLLKLVVTYFRQQKQVLTTALILMVESACM